MIIKNQLAVKILFVCLILFCTPAFAQTIELNTKQNFTILGPQFFPFSSISNNQLKELFPTNANVTLEFSNFLGSQCVLAPAADFAEIGPRTTVTGNGTITLDFSGKLKNVGDYGLSFLPHGNNCIFELLVKPPVVNKTSTSSSGGQAQERFTPNALTINTRMLPLNFVEGLSNDSSNEQCQNKPTGINNGSLNYDSLFDVLVNPPTGSSMSKSEKSLTFLIPDKKNQTKKALNIELTNTTDMTKIYITGIFPSHIENTSSSITEGAIQHSIIPAKMAWQLSSNKNGFYITKGGGCSAPFCTNIKSSAIENPNSACTPDKLTKRKATYPELSLSNFFAPFGVVGMTIQISSSNINNSKQPLTINIAKDRAYLILQPVPPKAMIVQELMISLKKS